MPPRAVDAGGADEAELRPARDDDPRSDARELADGVQRHLGVVRARLQAQVAAADGRVEVVADEVRQVGERRGALRREPETPVEE